MATSGKRVQARMYKLLFSVFDEADTHRIVWMPAHTKEHEVGVTAIGNGRKLTWIDRRTNQEADKLAKLAVTEHRVLEHIRTTISNHEALQAATAK